MCFHVRRRHVSQSRPTVRQPWYLLLLGKDSYASPQYYAYSLVFCLGHVNIYTKPSYL